MTIADRLPKPAKRKKQRSVVTVRLAGRLHARLKELAGKRKCSLNELCVAALEQADEELSELEESP